jgi:hypothetical protein
VNARVNSKDVGDQRLRPSPEQMARMKKLDVSTGPPAVQQGLRAS